MTSKLSDKLSVLSMSNTQRAGVISRRVTVVTGVTAIAESKAV